MAEFQWRNLSVPQRAALRQLRDRGSAAVGYGEHELGERVAKTLLNNGLAALPAGSRAYCGGWGWLPSGTVLQLTAAGQELVHGH